VAATIHTKKTIPIPTENKLVPVDFSPEAQTTYSTYSGSLAILENQVTKGLYDPVLHHKHSGFL
jgi:hypothetical protein